jgi:hypothetical protein
MTLDPHCFASITHPTPPQLERAVSCGVLFGAPSVKEPLVGLMQLEARCVRQWYPGSGAGAFFERFAGARAGAARLGWGR